MAKGKITYKQFITKFNNAEDKVEFCKLHITNKYVDYQTKLTEVRKIADIGSYSSIPSLVEGEEDRKVYKRNTPIMYYLLKMRLLADYTDIDIKDGEELETFNALEEVGAVDGLLASIPENELTKWHTMLEMTNDDIYANERDFASYLDTKIDAVTMVLNTLLSGLGDVVGKLESEQNED